MLAANKSIQVYNNSIFNNKVNSLFHIVHVLNSYPNNEHLRCY